MDFTITEEWRGLSKGEQTCRLFEKQKQLLDTFLEHHTISRAQYDKSLWDLIEKMHTKNKP